MNARGPSTLFQAFRRLLELSFPLFHCSDGERWVFSGNLSLEVSEGSKWNITRSGFCGMRSKKFDGFIDLDAYDTIALKLKGDGRCYISTIYTENWVNSPGQLEDNSWQSFVFVPEDNWYIAKSKACSFAVMTNSSFSILPTWRGNVIDAKLEMNQSRILGMSLSVNAEGGIPGTRSGPVLSDANKRFLYDVGAYDSDEEENGMGDFLSEMATMMSKTKPNENGESFEELQELFEQIFQEDIESFGGSCQAAAAAPTTTLSSSTSSSYASYSESSRCNDKRNSSEMNFGGFNDVEGTLGFGSHFQKFCLGVEHQQNFKKGKGARGGVMQGGAGGRSGKGHGRKPKVSSSGLNVSSQDHGISTS
ncbi:hypothetical protein GH714_018282 [Hevea brasiliensis]|uniref:NADH:ubiquinone oxidoreductase intermediate-associated protein 30 domain-containing protein n=1 Tax=Hevea brasiliensis TaxID=3981 RepID=A0A6A6LMS9_HEVBR|nr:hypothetical protein GH714_018282 [Hevea brasiliensis]